MNRRLGSNEVGALVVHLEKVELVRPGNLAVSLDAHGHPVLHLETGLKFFGNRDCAGSVYLEVERLSRHNIGSIYLSNIA